MTRYKPIALHDSVPGIDGDPEKAPAVGQRIEPSDAGAGLRRPGWSRGIAAGSELKLPQALFRRHETPLHRAFLAAEPGQVQAVAHQAMY
ncbi:hypothetical protein GCM10011289_20220 [Paludibacterium paludis]|uniref:Uncharacterized protein n=1 Tax=Paludibacterium paludis TaxID=1225769 RepID=A0A918P3X6_9NEIS|nr:hypothetical protein GCM10011289_20220 [Paludibacterium paludis]